MKIIVSPMDDPIVYASLIRATVNRVGSERNTLSNYGGLPIQIEYRVHVIQIKYLTKIVKITVLNYQTRAVILTAHSIVVHLGSVLRNAVKSPGIISTITAGVHVMDNQ